MCRNHYWFDIHISRIKKSLFRWLVCKISFLKLLFTTVIVVVIETSWKNVTKYFLRTTAGIIDSRCSSCAETCTTRLHRSSRAWVTSDYVTSVPCRISRLPTALSRCWDNGSIRMDHDPGLDMPGTLEINARLMIPTVLFHRRRKRGNGSFLVHLSVIWINCICHCRISVSQDSIIRMIYLQFTNLHAVILLQIINRYTFKFVR